MRYINSFLIICLIMMTGCAIQGKYEISRPTIGDKSGRYKNNRISRFDQTIDLNGLNLFVAPQNDWILWEVFAVTIIPVWISTNKSVRGEGQPFIFEIAFSPKEDGFSFDPMKTSLQIDQVGSIKPYQANGPMPKYHRGYYSENSESELLSSGHVLCGGENSDVQSVYPILLKKGPLWTCFQIKFDIPIPSPKHDITLKIDGIQKNNNDFEIPEINFEKLEEGRGDSCP